VEQLISPSNQCAAYTAAQLDSPSFSSKKPKLPFANDIQQLNFQGLK